MYAIGGKIVANRLPEKLSTLRKHFSYSLAEVAEKTNVPVTEYMKWENGNSLCGIEQLNHLAQIFHVPLIELLDNTKEVTLPDLDKVFDSVQIPFMEGNTITYTNAIPLSDEQAEKLLNNEMDQPEQEYESLEEQGHTRVIQKDQLQATTVQHVVEEKPKKKKTTSWMDEKVFGLKLPVFMGVVVGVLLLLSFAGFFLFGNRDNTINTADNKITDSNRLALAETYSAYLNEQGQIVIHGNAPTTSSFTDVVQIVSGKRTLYGLKKDGTVVASESGLALDQFKNITYIEAGESHLVGLKKDGSVVCIGDEKACEVTEWKDVKSIYAGDDITIGIDDKGTVQVAGSYNAASQLNTISNVKDIIIDQQQAIVIHPDGSLTGYSTGTGSAPAVNQWSDIKEVAIGSNFIAGLTNTGKIQMLSSNASLLKSAEEFTNIQHIAARNNTLVAVNGNGQVVGLGDNAYNQYEDNSQTADPNATPDAKLAQVKNIRFAVTTQGVSISWDAVMDTEYYEVVINTNPETKVKSPTSSTSISTNKFEHGKTYTVTVTPYPKDAKKYAAGDPATIQYEYKAASVKLGTVQGVTSSLDGTKLNVSWQAVEHADYYNVAIESMVQKVNDTKVELDASHMEPGREYTIHVTAMSNDIERYTESDAGTATFTYQAPVIVKPLKEPTITEYKVNDDNSLELLWSGDENADHYDIVVGNQTYTTNKTSIKIPSEKDGKAILNDGTTYTVTITAVPKDEKAYRNSSSTKDVKYETRKPDPTPTPTPAPTPEPTPEESKEPEKEEEKNG